jgi:hypothetical protein
VSTNATSNLNMEEFTLGSARPASGLMIRLLPGLTSLVYTVVVWSISGVSAFTLPLTLIPLIASIACIFQIRPLNSYPRAVAVAHLGVAAPALYNFMGALLDFRKSYPFHGNVAWVALWGALVVLVGFEKPGRWSNRTANQSSLKSAHGVAAAAITLFALFHITNHLAGIAGGQAHLALMQAFRTVYRNPLVEGLLAIAVLFQVVSGIVLLRRRLMTSNRFEILQGAAGAYLLVFLWPTSAPFSAPATFVTSIPIGFGLRPLICSPTNGAPAWCPIISWGSLLWEFTGPAVCATF